MKQRAYGFTIVELLIVVVVIAILAALTTVVYINIQRNAQLATVQADVANISKALKVYNAEHGDFPTSITACPTPGAEALCLPVSGGNELRYNRRPIGAVPNQRTITAGHELSMMNDGGFTWVLNADITSTNEFIHLVDTGPIIDRYGLVDYRLSFDIKTASATPGSTMRAYMQNGSGSKYEFTNVVVPVSTNFTRQEIVFRPFMRSPELSQSWVALYGTYDTGNIPTVRNVRFELAKQAATCRDIL